MVLFSHDSDLTTNIFVVDILFKVVDILSNVVDILKKLWIYYILIVKNVVDILYNGCGYTVNKL